MSRDINLYFVFQVIFLRIGIPWDENHHETPPFGRICFGTFPSSKHRRFPNPSDLEL